MQTLHEYMMETKAIEYIMAVVFLGGFAVFWSLLFRENRRPSRRRRLPHAKP
jgi:hypothetical protein